MPDVKENSFLKTIRSIAEGSNKISTWSLSVIGGSLLAILSTSYLQPGSIDIKLFYLLFIAGWILMAMSINYGINISGRSMAAELYAEKDDQLKKIFSNSNTDFIKQLKYFKWALFVFSLWLTVYLLWWIFIYVPKPIYIPILKK